jgi:sulfide:quinone oxidoreductase
MRILVLGAGFGGLELTTRLSDALGDAADIVLIDQADGFVFGFSKLDVMFGRTTAEAVRHSYRDLVKPGVRFVQAAIRSIDPAATPGLVEAGREFYTVDGAFAARDVLESFGGGRVIIGVTSTPFKCPPAPSETALMLHDYLVERGRRDASQISLVMPLGVPIPPSPAASQALLAAFEERGISWHPERLVRGLDPERRVAILADGDELPFDLFLGVPVHRVPAVVAESGMCVDGWIPVDPLTLETAYPDVYAVGDVTSVGTPKAGVFSERQASVVADQLIARHGPAGATSTYDGKGICYIEFGHDRVARVEVTFRSGQRPNGQFDEPSDLLLADKAEFGTSRIRRWFDRDWTSY